MARRRLNEGLRWQIIGMHTSGMSCRAIGANLNFHHTTISRLINKHRDTGEVKDRPRTGRPRKTTAREDRLVARLARAQPILNSRVLRQRWMINARVSTSTVRRRLRAAGLRACRPVRRPFLTARHMQERLTWSRARIHWNLRSWRRIHWSDESRFLLHMTDGRQRVWRQRRTAYNQHNILPTIPFGGGSVMVWVCVSHDCKLELITVQGTLNAQRYQTNILDTTVIPHFEDHTLASHPIFMDDNARPHRARAVRDHLIANAIETLQWPARSPDINPIEHLWDQLGRRVRARDPPVENLLELEQALHEEWNNIPMQSIRSLIQSMRRRLQSVINARGGYTQY